MVMIIMIVVIMIVVIMMVVVAVVVVVEAVVTMPPGQARHPRVLVPTAPLAILA